MDRVLIIEQDTDLRWVLEVALKETGYAVIAVEDVELAHMAVAVSSSPLVVLISYGGDEVERARTRAMMEQAGSMPPHAYVVLSTRPELTPRIRNPHTGRVMPLLAEPVELDTLLAAVDNAAKRLTRIAIPVL